MSERYIAFDVETPNSANDRMSAIGISVIENGRIVRDYDYLVNPEAGFDRFNIRLTGITPEMVSDQLSFPELWKAIEPVMGSGLLIAHFAQFDMQVLSKCLQYYGIVWHPYAYYACTCTMGRACYPNLVNHKLDTMCEYLSIGLEHHHAGSDSRACASLLVDYLQHGIDTDKYKKKWNFTHKGSQLL
ncbi:MAG TPA: 3'-5' exonuclease [Lachnospiraceae bacterium]|nr:3'-5' exonuclease [Lachnospiraceae bacterium]